MEELGKILPELSLSAIGTALTLCLKISIDTFNMTGVEKKILTNSKKIFIHVSQISIFSIICSVFFLMIMIIDGSVSNKIGELLAGFVITFVTVIIISATVYSFLMFFVHFFSYKYSYIFKDKDIEWSIIRVLDKERLIVLQDNKVLKFVKVEDIFHRDINTVLDMEKPNRKKWLYQHDENVHIIRVFITYLMCVSLIILSTTHETSSLFKGVALLLVLLSYFLWLHYFIVKNNGKILDFYNSNSISEDVEITTE